MNCVRCNEELVPRLYEGVEIDRCPSCNGAWLDSGELTKIVETREITIARHVIEETLASAFKGVPQDEQRSVERCPRCAIPMVAINYDYTSGIIIDRCPSGHGNWVDGGELERLQAHAEHWEAQGDESNGDWIAFARAVSARPDSAADENRRREMRPTRYLVNSIIRRLLGG